MLPKTEVNREWWDLKKKNDTGKNNIYIYICKLYYNRFFKKYFGISSFFVKIK